MATINRRSQIKLKWHILSNLSDSQLLWLFNETGTREYYSELFMRYLPLVYGMCLKYMPDEDQAQDAVKRLFDVSLEEFETRDFAGDSFRDWLYQTTSRFLKTEAKENRIAERHYFSSRIEATLSDKEFEFAKILEAGGRDAEQLFHQVEHLLTKPERESIYMFFLKRRSFRTIAMTTGYLSGSVKKYIESGLGKMAREYDLETILS